MTESQNRDKRQYRQLAFGYVAAYVVLFAGVCAGAIGQISQVPDVQYAPTTTANTTNRLEPLYWVTGNGRWAARWDNTGNDARLAIASIAGTLWMVYEYCRYARNCANAFQQLQRSVAKEHVLHLRSVFVQSMLIHACTGILVWWLPTFWLIAIFTFANAWQTRQLNTTKIQLLHANELAATAAMRAATLQVLDNTQLAIHERLDQVKTLLMQRVS